MIPFLSLYKIFKYKGLSINKWVRTYDHSYTHNIKGETTCSRIKGLKEVSQYHSFRF